MKTLLVVKADSVNLRNGYMDWTCPFTDKYMWVQGDLSKEEDEVGRYLSHTHSDKENNDLYEVRGYFEYKA